MGSILSQMILAGWKSMEIDEKSMDLCTRKTLHLTKYDYVIDENFQLSLEIHEFDEF